MKETQKAKFNSSHKTIGWGKDQNNFYNVNENEGITQLNHIYVNSQKRFLFGNKTHHEKGC